ncbi:MAG: hypothetical protein ACHQ50_11055 [Fimbriimonadales bacterium]
MKSRAFFSARALLWLLLAVPAFLLAGRGLWRSGPQGPVAQNRAPVGRGPAEQEPSYDDTLRAYTELRAYPGKVVSWDQFDQAAHYRDTYPYPPVRMPRVIGHVGPPAPGWVYIGPKNMPGPGGFYGGAPANNAIYNGYGPLAGRVNAVAIATGAANSPIFAGSSSGGLWQGALNANNWTWLSADWDWLQVSSIAVNPKNPNEILVGTGDYHGSKPVGAVGIRKGVFNPGTGNWAFSNVVRALFHGKAVSKIVYDPESPLIVMATTGRGMNEAPRFGDVWRSVDGGTNWALASNINTHTLNWSDIVCGAMSPATGRRLYYAVGYDPTRIEIWRSADKGATWTQLTNPATLPAGARMGLGLATSPSAWNTVYLLAAVPSAGGATTSEIYSSANGGNAWTRIARQGDQRGFPWDDPASAAPDAYNWSQAAYDYYIACGERPGAGTAKIDVLYVGLITIAQSTDAGTSWRNAGYAYSANPNVTATDPDFRVHNDQHCLAFQPGNFNQAIAGCDGGAYVMNFDPAGAAAHNIAFDPRLNQNLFIAEFYKGAWGVDDANPNAILGGTQDNGTPRTDGANPPVWRLNLAFGDGSGSAISGRGSFYQYGAGYASGRVMSFKRTNDGSFWNSAFRPFPPPDPQPNFDDDRLIFAAGDTPGFFPPVASDHNNSDFCFAASDRLYKFIYGQGQGWGNTDWVQQSTQLLSTNQYVIAITIDPINDFRLYTGSLDAELWRSTYYGINNFWARVDGGGGGALPARPIADIAVNPNNPNQVFVALNGAAGQNDRVFVCDDITAPDATRSWRSISGGGIPPDLPVNCIALDPADPANKIYVGTDIGVFYTNNGGAVWNNGTAPLSLPNVQVNSLSIVGSGANETLNAATFGRGIWRTTLPLP